jgi:hypothetical protein
MKPAARIAIALCLAALPGRAQPSIAAEESARAKELLQSTHWSDKAWGAYFAGRLHDESFREPLIAELRLQAPLRNAPRDSEEYAYVQTLFDALIELGGKAPADAILPFEAQWRAEILILLARDATNASQLLAMREGDLAAIEWLAVNNLLLRMSPAALFAKTLPELKITHAFEIRDTEGGAGAGDGGSDCRGGLTRRMPARFPPIAFYRLDDAKVSFVVPPGLDFGSEDDVLLAQGPHNVYYKRIVVPAGGQAQIPDPASNPDRQLLRLEYIGRLGALTPGETDRLFRPRTTVRWQSADACSRAIETGLSAQAGEIRAFLANAKSRGLGDASGVQLEIVPVLDDQRRIAHEALPPVPPKVIGLE